MKILKHKIQMKLHFFSFRLFIFSTLEELKYHVDVLSSTFYKLQIVTFSKSKIYILIKKSIGSVSKNLISFFLFLLPNPLHHSILMKTLEHYGVN